MAVKTLGEFLAESAQKDASAESFELESPRMLEIRLQSRVWMRVISF